jgi:hypothetical protein
MTKNLKGLVYDELMERDHTLGELYKIFKTYHQRTVREAVCVLKTDKMLTVTSCRCHGASIYKGFCKACKKHERDGGCEEHRSYPNPWS